MSESVFFKPISLAFAIIIFIESLIWSVLSFISVLCYSDIIRFDPKNNYGLNKFTEAWYNLYLSGNAFDENSRAVLPQTFNILMWIYFIISLFLFFSSGVHIVVLSMQSKPRKVNFSTLIWLILNYTMCLFDLITCILFSIDYNKLRNYTKIDTAESELQLAVIITCIILAAKGFVLWILNLTFSIIITVLLKDKLKDQTIIKAGPLVHAKNSKTCDAYGDVTPAPDNLQTQYEQENRTRTNSQRSHNSDAVSLSSSDFQIDFKSNSIIPYNTPLTGVPLTRTASYVTPRSLVASLAPSPVSNPREEGFGLSSNPQKYKRHSASTSYLTSDYQIPDQSTDPNSEFRTRSKSFTYDYADNKFSLQKKNDSNNNNINIDDDDEIVTNPDYLKNAFPKLGRFSLRKKNEQENNDDDDEIALDPDYLKNAFPKEGRFSMKKKKENDDDDDIDNPEYLKNAFPNTTRFTLKEPEPDY